VPKSLKPGRHLADSGAVYFPLRSESLDLSAERLHGLRLSLNTPVLSIEELPVGPARAAIVIHEEIDGRPSLTVGVRSLRSGVGVLFSLEGDLREHSSLAVGIDAVLSFGESMGFLFDEDELETDFTEEARSRALGLWLELMGVESGASEMSPQVPAAPASPRPASEPDDSFEVEGLYDDEIPRTICPAPSPTSEVESTPDPPSGNRRTRSPTPLPSSMSSVEPAVHRRRLARLPCPSPSFAIALPANRRPRAWKRYNEASGSRPPLQKARPWDGSSS
jgi:hypothetical protein